MLTYCNASLVAQLVRNQPEMLETWIQSQGREESLEKGKATHSSILAWRNSMVYVVHGVAKSRTQLSDLHLHCVMLMSNLNGIYLCYI